MLLTMLSTWQNGDISNSEVFKGDFIFIKALGVIKAKAIVRPASNPRDPPGHAFVAGPALFDNGLRFLPGAVWPEPDSPAPEIPP